jgi:hypothetical protein
MKQTTDMADMAKDEVIKYEDVIGLLLNTLSHSQNNTNNRKP